MSKLSFFYYQDSDTRIELHEFSIEWFSSGRELSIQPLVEEFELVVLENYPFENRDLQFSTFLALSAYQDSDAKKKIHDFWKVLGQ